MIGDSPTLDVGGGRAAGLATVWVSRGTDWPDHLAPPDHTVKDLLAGVRVLQDAVAERGS
ncbi:HAD hydrolase-like protein [Micromonospora sp. NPDC000089]|uniref:HAD hydrolase-like protein n=1 Tax=unclassified Micromonospora TaxID=2617518 RepID=UPI0036A69CC9